MRSEKCNSILAVDTGLISSLFNVALLQNVLFANHSCSNACIVRNSSKAYLCSPLYSIPFSTTALVRITDTCFMDSESWVSAVSEYEA